MIKAFLSLFLGFALIISCASKDEKLQNYKVYVQKISSEIKFEDGFNTIKVVGERRSIFRSYFLNDELVFINEEESIGSRGNSANQYYFKDNQLIRYNQKMLLMRDDSLNIKTKTMIVLGMFLDDKTVLETEYWIGDVQSVIVENDVENIIFHAELLKELATKNRPRKK
ncbi:MAG: hypothetical protein IPJ23_06625 [Ignavibacteriales bacterium]|nr:hypothetical protein [Ignavibacteriales bacterium]